MDTILQFQDQIKRLRDTRAPDCAITFAHEDFGSLHTAQGLPQMHFDQLQAVTHHLNCIKYSDNYNLYEDQDEGAIAMKAIAEGIIPHKFTCRILKQRDDWSTWEQSKWKQLSSYQKQNIPPLKKHKEGKFKPSTVLPFVWTYLFKDGNTLKARGTCNGCKRYDRAITMAPKYASCVEQSASCMFWSLAALNGMTVIGTDAGNSFAEADPLKDPLFMSIDEQYQR